MLTAFALLIAACNAPTQRADDAAPGPPALSAPGTDWASLEINPATLRAEHLAEFARISGIDDPPAVEIIEEVSLSEVAEVKAACMVAAGHPVRVSQEGIILDGEVANPHAFNLQMYICEAQYPTDARVGLVLPRVRAEIQFEYLTESVTPCLRQLGFEVPAPPSLQVWLDQYYGSASDLWDPFVVAASSPSSLDEAYAACPSLAPDLYP